jgi:choline kinase
VKGVILAAGRGSRLGALTDHRPKCLVPLAGQPLLAWQRDALIAGGADETAIVVGYQADLLSRLGMPTFHAPRWDQTNMVVSLCAAAPWLRTEPCVVSYGDIVFEPAAVRALVAARGDLAITYDPRWHELWSRRFDDPLEDAETFVLADNGSVARIGGRAADVEEIEGQYMGLLRFTPASWAAVEATLDRLSARQRDRLDMTGLLQLLIYAGHRVEAVPYRGGWGEVDHESDLEVCESLVAQRLLRRPDRRAS